MYNKLLIIFLLTITICFSGEIKRRSLVFTNNFKEFLKDIITKRIDFIGFSSFDNAEFIRSKVYSEIQSNVYLEF
ncbi:MAG: hypothetical protein WCT85_06660 [Parachlamydiales bacterium]|jgi:hypothetical protein